MANTLAGKRVLFVFDCLELGGAERQALFLAAHLKQVQGMHVSVLGLYEKEGEITRLCDATGIPSQGVRCDLSRSGVDLLKSLSRVLKVLRQLRPDLILPYTARPNIVCGLLWRLTSAKGCVWNQRDEGMGLKAGICLPAVRLSSCFVSNSAAGKRFLVEIFGLRNDHVQLVSNGIALATPVRNRREWRESLGVGEDCFLVSMVANLHQFKDHATLVRAWRRVLDRAPRGTDAVLVLAGRPAGEEQRLRMLVDELGLERSVRIAGSVSDVSGLLHASDLCVHSSFTEGVPNAVLEAMAAGVPVVATDIPGIREAVGPEGAFGLVAPKSPDAMAFKILEYMQDTALREDAAKALKERVDTRFSMPAMVGAMVLLLEKSLLGSRFVAIGKGKHVQS